MANSSVRTLGTGPHAVMCLNGWFGCGSDWGPMEQVLDTETFSWIFPDYRGYGSRIDEGGEFTLDEVSADLLLIIDQLGDYDSISVLGHSMGGVFAQRLLDDANGRVDGFIGISPVPASGSPMPTEQRQLFEAAASDVSSRRSIIDITTGQRLSARWLDEMAEATRETSTEMAVGQYFRTWADCDFIGRLGTQKIPALVIVGHHDPAVTVETVQGSYGSTYDDLSVIEFPDAGHYAMYEAPIRLTSEIETFLKNRIVEA